MSTEFGNASFIRESFPFKFENLPDEVSLLIYSTVVSDWLLFGWHAFAWVTLTHDSRHSLRWLSSNCHERERVQILFHLPRANRKTRDQIITALLEHGLTSTHIIAAASFVAYLPIGQPCLVRRISMSECWDELADLGVLDRPRGNVGPPRGLFEQPHGLAASSTATMGKGRKNSVCGASRAICSPMASLSSGGGEELVGIDKPVLHS